MTTFHDSQQSLLAAIATTRDQWLKKKQLLDEKQATNISLQDYQLTLNRMQSQLEAHIQTNQSAIATLNQLVSEINTDNV
jgi:hypothetical protein